MNLEKKIKRKKNHIFTLMGRALLSRPPPKPPGLPPCLLLPCPHATPASLASALATQRPYTGGEGRWPSLPAALPSRFDQPHPGAALQPSCPPASRSPFGNPGRAPELPSSSTCSAGVKLPHCHPFFPIPTTSSSALDPRLACAHSRLPSSR